MSLYPCLYIRMHLTEGESRCACMMEIVVQVVQLYEGGAARLRVGKAKLAGERRNTPVRLEERKFLGLVYRLVVVFKAIREAVRKGSLEMQLNVQQSGAVGGKSVQLMRREGYTG